MKLTKQDSWHKENTQMYMGVCVCEYIAFIETGCIVKYIVYK